MRNSFLNYLKSNDPEKVVSRAGVKVRKLIFPALRLILKIANPYKQIVVRKAEMPKNRPIIYASTHGFKDDVLNAFLLTNDHAYMLMGALEHFYNTVEGIIAWMIGVIVVDRDDKSSRIASLLKMQRTMELGTNVIIYPEGAWNLTDSMLVMKLYDGVYRLAKLTGALVAPIVTHVERNNCYAILDESFDITEYECTKGLIILRNKMATLKYELIAKYSSFARAELEADGKTLQAAWSENKQKILSKAHHTIREQERHSIYRFKDKNITEYEEAFAHLREIEITKNNAFLLRPKRAKSFDEVVDILNNQRR